MGKINNLIAFMLLMLIASNVTEAQVMAFPECDIEIDTELPVCPDIYFELKPVEEMQPDFSYEWFQKNISGVYESVGNEYKYASKILDSTTYKLVVIDTINHDTCPSIPFGVGIHSLINIEFEQLQLTCTNGDEDNGNDAKVRAIASGEFEPEEYHYFWDVHPLQISSTDSAVAQGLKAYQYYTITVRDDYGCPTTDKFFTLGYTNPLVDIYADPDTAAYIQNPFVTYSYINLSEDSIPITNHFWWFSDTIPDPDNENTSELFDPTYEYGAIGDYEVLLTVYNPEGCDTSFYKSMKIKPVKLLIPNVFTPGDGGANETFEITDEDRDYRGPDALKKFYISSRLVVFNRSGRTVYESENYDNSWTGDNLPDGVYYFVLECIGAKSSDVFKGSVTIIRAN